MIVFKFGGASISTTDRIKNTAGIIGSHAAGKCLVVISAMGKTTNALEKVAEAFFEGRTTDALSLFEKIKQNHLDIIKYLVVTRWKDAEDKLKEIFTEIEWLLHDKPVRSYDYYYDQIVCCGELMSSAIMSVFLEENGISNKWLDVRDVLRTDDNFRDAAVDWAITAEKSEAILLPMFTGNNVVITQGFVGSTIDNESTTLGREGSDFTAAIFANLLKAENVTIWKDVEAVMNADPRIYPNAVSIPELSYREVIEMAYYGAQVIHPKTIKPLQNAGIPLIVKSFIDPTLPGTVISDKNVKSLPPVIVIKKNQALLTFRTKDFSFMEGSPVEALHQLFSELRIKSNLSQHTAISLITCFDEHNEKTGMLAETASTNFEVSLEKGLTLLTIRHYTEEVIQELLGGKTIILEQKTTDTLQAVLREF